jgi:tRNA pseudouridine55 synthase
VADADEERIVPLDDALAFLPAVALEGDDARKAGHGVAVEGAAGGPVRLRDEAGLIAIAEPRGDGTLKPVVGFRG